jgi:drug/metabolite transporter (DMT)-like permease
MTEDHPSIISPELVMALSVLAVSTGAVFIRLAQQEAPSLVIAAYRLGLGSLFLAPFALSRSRGEIRRLTRQQWLLALLSGVFLALHFASWITSLEYTTVASSVVLVSMSPLIVALLSTFLLHEPLSAMTWVGLPLALLGSFIVAFSDQISIGVSGITIAPFTQVLQHGALMGNVLAFLGAVFVAGYLILGRKLRASLSLLTYAFIVFGSAAVVLLVMALSAGESLAGYSWITYLWFLCLGLIPQIFGHASFNWALRYLPASFVSIALLGEPVGASLLAYVLLKETPSLLEVGGGVLILFGIYLASRRGTKSALQQGL